MNPTRTIFGYPVYVELEIGGVSYEVKDGVYLDAHSRPMLDLNKITDLITEKTQPCRSCGTKPGEVRRS